jgi:hypothetical protein
MAPAFFGLSWDTIVGLCREMFSKTRFDEDMGEHFVVQPETLARCTQIVMIL